jgi:integrase
MTKKKPQISTPTLRMRQDRDYACTYLKGKKIQLGRWGSPEADVKFRQLQIQVLTDPTFSFFKQQGVTVDDLCLAYLNHAKENDPSHYHGINTAVKIFLKHYAGQAVNSLDSRHFVHLQSMFVGHGKSRQYCNMLMQYIRAMLKWGSLRKLVSAVVHAEAKLVPHLKKGKTPAPEKKKRKDVPDETVDRTLLYLLPTLRDMVQVQRLASMRPSEMIRMKPGEIDMENVHDGVVIWLYVPGRHKNDWRDDDYARIIPLGKPEQDIISARLVGKSDDDYIFSPKDTMREWYEQRAIKRKTKIPPSQIKRMERNAKKSRCKVRDCYDANSYNRAITRGITAANKNLPDKEKIRHWTPYQLRHTGITALTKKTGSLDIARAVAGQRSLNTTAIYNHADLKISMDQAVKRSQESE